MCKKCVFPFTFHGKTYSSCTYVNQVSMRPWCATSEAFDDESQEWGDCHESCPEDATSKSDENEFTLDL